MYHDTRYEPAKADVERLQSGMFISIRYIIKRSINMFSVAQLLLQRMALNIKEIQVTWEKPPALVKRETRRFRHVVGWKTCRFLRSFCRYFIRPEFKVAEEIAKMIDPASELSKRESIFLRQTLNEVFITSHIGSINLLLKFQMPQSVKARQRRLPTSKQGSLGASDSEAGWRLAPSRHRLEAGFS